MGGYGVSFVMVWFSFQDGHGPIYLFAEEQPYHLV